MNKIILTIMMSLSLMANEIQVFTSNTMFLELDKNTKIEKIYLGTYKDLLEKSKENKSKDLTKAGVGSNLAGSSAAFSTTSVEGGLVGTAIGIVGSIAIAAGIEAYDSITSDHEYIMISIATNSKGEQTKLSTLIVSNEKLELNEVEKIALQDQKSELKD